MMDYETFKSAVERSFKDYLPEEYADGKVEIQKVKKVNETKDGLVLVNAGQVSPTIYLDDMYGYYVKGHSMEETMQSIAELYEDSVIQVPDDFSAMFDFENAKENLVIQLINTEQNEELLESLPHREFCDLSVICAVRVSIDGMEGNVKVSDALLKRFGVTEDELFEAAYKSNKKAAPYCIFDIRDMLSGCIGGMPEELERGTMLVLTNQEKSLGASFMLYDDMMQRVAENFDGDFYIIPSSIHELIAVKADGNDPEALMDMVESVNACCVDMKEQLSNQVYRYDSLLHRVEPAVDTPAKKLGSIGNCGIQEKRQGAAR